MFGKILLDMPITYIIINSFFKNRHAWSVTEGPKLWCYSPPPPPLTVFSPTSFTYQKHLKIDQCLEIDDRIPLSKFGDVK